MHTLQVEYLRAPHIKQDGETASPHNICMCFNQLPPTMLAHIQNYV